jgi:hypothetical protein
MVNGRTFALGAIGGAGVSVQLALARHAVASTGSATEEASQSGIAMRTPVCAEMGRAWGSCLAGADELGPARQSIGGQLRAQSTRDESRGQRR